jgi:hypothetical protein
MHAKEHWENVYSTKSANAVSWYQEHAGQSLPLIRETGVPLDGSVIDVGGGASTLVDDLLAAGYSRLAVLDLSAAALAAAKWRLGRLAMGVEWLEADITEVVLPASAYDVWHDRAVFHFLTDPEQRAAYVRAVLHAVKHRGARDRRDLRRRRPDAVQRASRQALQFRGVARGVWSAVRIAEARNGRAPHSLRECSEVRLLLLPQVGVIAQAHRNGDARRISGWTRRSLCGHGCLPAGSGASGSQLSAQLA